jgi:hypothetical protein
MSAERACVRDESFDGDPQPARLFRAEKTNLDIHDVSGGAVLHFIY